MKRVFTSAIFAALIASSALAQDDGMMETAASAKLSACVDGISFFWNLQRVSTSGRMDELEALAKAGERDEACKTFSKLQTYAEHTRQGLLACYKSIPQDTDIKMLRLKKYSIEKAQLVNGFKNQLMPALMKKVGCGT